MEGGEVPKASEIVEVEEDKEDDDDGQRDEERIIVVEEEEIEENSDEEDEAEVEEDEEEEEEEEDDVALDSDDVLGKRPPTRKLHLGVLSKCRLRMPNRKMMKRYSDVLLRSSSRGAKMALDTIHREHELALMIRNIAELSTLSGHSLRRYLRMDATRKRYRREMRRLRVENNRLMEELNFEKKEFIELATASDQLKADVVRVIKENEMLEKENEELKAALKKEKEKVRTSEFRMDALRERNIVEKRNMVEARLPKQMDFMMKEAQREYLESNEFQGMFNLLSSPILRNGWRLRLAKVRRVLEEDDPLIGQRCMA
ncbi:hypothetical protein Dimus_008326 [Dionaea muscipula]